MFVDEGIDYKIRQNTAPIGVAVSVHFSYDPIHLTTHTQFDIILKLNRYEERSTNNFQQITVTNC